MHLTKVLIKTSDPEELICSETKSVNSENIEEMDGKALHDVFDDVYQFCCSFVEKQTFVSIEQKEENPFMQCSIDFNCLMKFYKNVFKHFTAEKINVQ